ncbi:TonB family protein [Gilvimarinus agarilyticus]|uniref:TonB family protein n=1 Tax=Gilvimarinus agarilyticus TaxID=679259 RepID=UPI0009FD67D6|nr:TonB family protein [Gilvimarinus agarilyticus]
MKRTVFCCSAMVAIFMMLLPVQRAMAAPDGVAPYIELQRELFLAGLYLPEPVSNAQQAVELRGSRQMELRFVAESMTAGKLSRMFLQSIAINNSAAAQRASGESLASFFNAFKGSLRRGDILAISERTDGSGANVYLNRERLVSVDDASFFNLLLVTWIGSVPPSREFKSALLGGSAAADVARFDQISPSPERLSLVEQWQNPSPESASVASLAQVSSAAESSASVASEPAVPVVAAVFVPQPKLEMPTLVAPVAAEAQLPASVEQSTTAQVSPLAEARSSVASEPSPAPVASAPAPEPEEDLPDFSAESLGMLQDYTAQLVTLTHAEIKYPRRAMKLEQTGSVRMAVVIDRAGEVLEVQPLLESGFKQLDDAVRRAIDKAAPYPAIPDDLTAEHFEFVFPITFMLERS